METLTYSNWGGRPASSVGSKEVAWPEELGPGVNLRAFMGWDGLIVRDASLNLVDMCREYAARAKNESCGQCFPCRLGLEEMHFILERICQGQGKEADLERLERLAGLIRQTARCDIGQTSPRPVLDALTHFRGQFTKAIKEKEAIPEGRYAAQVSAPCINACPSHLDIPGYIEKIRFGQENEALQIIRRDCCLPGVIGRVCVRPCESNCRRGLLDEPVAIKALKRFAADRELFKGIEPQVLAAEPKKDKVAIVGAGPAGLACAYYLGLRGYKTTIFEALPEPGGMAAVGIPDYRLPRQILRGEVALVEKLGAKIRYGLNVGQDISIADLTRQGFRAVFIGVGAQESAKMRCEGEEAGYQCFMTGIDFLRQVAFGRKPLEGKKIVVIGGGNVAMDCVRSSVRLGFEEVHLIYRRTKAEMPADPAEIKEAEEEGIKFHYLVQPIKVLAKDGRASGLECLRMELGEPDESGRPRPVPVAGSNFTLDCDAIIPAIGQVCVVDCVLPEAEEVSQRKSLIVDEMTFQTSQKQIFGGGDCVTGPATLIAALAAGKNAARFIAQYVEGGDCQPEEKDYLDRLISRLGIYDPEEKMAYPGFGQRPAIPTLAPEVRNKSFAEVEGGLSQAQALKEAARCLRCYRIGLAAI